MGEHDDAGTGPIDTATVDTAHLEEILLGRWAETKRVARELLKDPQFHKTENLTKEDHRERTLKQAHALVEANAVHRAFPEEFGGDADHGANIAAFEELVTADPSLQIKAGVQWGLFGAAVMHLGSHEHQKKWLPGIMDLSVPGAYAMTEIGHGSDVASLGTTATYDAATDEFIIHTPFEAATKRFLGNAALHATAAVVFAQLITEGVNHGVHCFYMEIRDEQGNPLPGITIEDDGHKGGLNGVDNGRLRFDQVRVPRTNLLNRYGDVAEGGAYSSPIESPGRRFFTMLGTLVQGRVSLTGAAVAAAKLGLIGAVTYGNQRRQFNATSTTEEEVLLDYQLHQRRLIPRLATTVALGFAHDNLLAKLDDVFSGKDDSDENRQELETLAAAIKPVATWHALDTLQEAREACGGAGFISENRFTSLRADLDVYVTFEGDNNVLLQLVAKRLLADYAAEFKNADVGALASYVANQAGSRVMHRFGLRKALQEVQDTGDERRSANWFKQPEVQRDLLSGRVRQMVADAAGELRHVAKLPPEKQATVFNEHQYQIINAAKAHADLLLWEAFTEGLEQVEHPGTKQVMTWLRDIYALTRIEETLDWYLINGRVSGQRARTLTPYINRLVARVRPHAQDVVDSFGYAPEHVRMEVASGAEQARQDAANEYYRKLRASSDAPVEEKTLLDRKRAQKRAAKKQ
ncbi:acyl-CoA dehydrogenase family protein [Nesterenkonia alkaliphila]|uniref:acyl-CoA oxidase n=1 Tax=Nesterenkonia alkaliphila TaxID=1463631 RepID=A0A7K1UNH7_9MICC|nr:acyl-CoA dehydrogenase [Nesterenkonia alkaliphila]MVT27571.1 acyl-CoA dehydrogenase [Nesterenkonia alkaliphila]GFZ79999.1 acyl-CoA dehydrogenase [Nesterenkonia alkaliphila]